MSLLEKLLACSFRFDEGWIEDVLLPKDRLVMMEDVKRVLFEALCSFSPPNLEEWAFKAYVDEWFKKTFGVAEVYTKKEEES